MEVKLPKLGEGSESGTVVGILVKPGDQVEKGQTILELENEKAVAPIPSTGAGVIEEIRVKEGDTISVGQVIATLSGEAGPADSGESEKPATESAPASESDPEPTAVAPQESPGSSASFNQDSGDRPMPAASPSIRRMARQLGLDLTRVRPSGRGGRVEMEDLKAYVLGLQERVFASPQSKTGTSPGAAPKVAPPGSVDFSRWGEVTKEKLSPIRQTISRRMLENWNAIPHVTQFDEVDITDLGVLRKKVGPAYEKKGTKLTLTPILLKALAGALKKHPIFNASLDEATQEVVLKQYYHIGLAVDTDQGLLVPVVRDVDKKSVLELAQDVNALAEKARQRKVSLEEMQGGTFTLSNQGGIGGAHFTPIINRPEVAILGLGRATKKVMALKDGQEVRLMMPMGLSYDHRLIDGGTAARFTVDLIEAIQSLSEKDLKLT